MRKKSKNNDGVPIEELDDSSLLEVRSDTKLLVNKDIELYRFFVIFIEQKWVVATIILTIAIISVSICYFSTPIYRAEILLSPASDANSRTLLERSASQFSGIAMFSCLRMGSSSSTDEALATLKSRQFTIEFIRDYNIMPYLFDIGENSTLNSNQVLPSVQDGFELFDKKIRFVKEDKKTGLVTLAINWKDSKLAAQWANKMIEVLNIKMRQKTIGEAQKSIDYLQLELSKTSVVELQKAVFELIQVQINNIMLANVRKEFSFKVIDPAVAPDIDNYVEPKRILITTVGFVVSILLAIMYVVIRKIVIDIKNRFDTYQKHINSQQLNSK